MPRPRTNQPIDSMPEAKVCPDCFAEGRDPYMLPVTTHFYVVKSPRYKGGYRISAYCREHTIKRQQAQHRQEQQEQQRLRQVEQETGITPEPLAKVRERKRRIYDKQRRTETAEQRAARLAKQQGFNRKRRENATEEERARVREANRKWQQEHPEANRAKARRWLSKNREIANARRRKRGWIISPDPTPAPPPDALAQPADAQEQPDE